MQGQSKSFGQSSAFENLTLNLLSGALPQKSTPKNVSQSIKCCRVVISAISIIFILLLLTNYVLDAKIMRLKQDQETLSLKVLRNFQTENEVKDLYARLVYYKKRQSEKPTLFDKTSFVIENFSVEVGLNKLDITKDGFTINVVGENPASFTKLIYKYLESDFVSEIILKSASYNSRENIYRVGMEGVFSNE